MTTTDTKATTKTKRKIPPLKKARLPKNADSTGSAGGGSQYALRTTRTETDLLKEIVKQCKRTGYRKADRAKVLRGVIHMIGSSDDLYERLVESMRVNL